MVLGYLRDKKRNKWHYIWYILDENKFDIKFSLKI